MFEPLLLLRVDIEVCPRPTTSEIPDLDALLKAKALQIFCQNVRGSLSSKNYLVELIDFFKKVQVLTLAETHIKI